MSEMLFNAAIDAKLAQIEDTFRQNLEEVLSTALTKPCSVLCEGPHVFDFRTIKGLFPEQSVVATVPFADEATGELKILLEPSTAAFFADLMMMGDGTASFSAQEHLDAIQELAFQILGAHATALSALLERKISFGNVQVAVLDISPSDFTENNWVWSRCEISLEGERSIVKMMSHTMVHALASAVEEEAKDMKEEESKAGPSAPKLTARKPLEMDPSFRDMSLLLDIELPITIELGRTSLLVREILNLGPGAIVELDKLSGEPVDIFVNDKKFARGEVVIIEENFGVRITEVLRSDERLKALSD